MIKHYAFCLIILASILVVRKLVLVNREQIVMFIEKITPSKYSPNNSDISTVSTEFVPPRFSNESENINFEDIDVPIPPSLFKLDDTDQLRSLFLACEPESFGYSQEQGQYTFPNYTYPTCSKVNDQEDTRLKIIDGKLVMDCPSDFKGRYITGPVGDQKLAKQEEVDSL